MFISTVAELQISVATFRRYEGNFFVEKKLGEMAMSYDAGLKQVCHELRVTTSISLPKFKILNEKGEVQREIRSRVYDISNDGGAVDGGGPTAAVMHDEGGDVGSFGNSNVGDVRQRALGVEGAGVARDRGNHGR